MSKICAKCEKPVYPLEELKCLDKIWHKGCFKCWECGMSLNMKNYKGFDRKPYCSAHYPQTKATVVADTPELQRLSQTSKLQSQAKYHEEFEKKIKGSKIQVADDPETQRLKQLSSVVSQVEYKGLREKNMDMEARRQNVSQPEVPEKSFRRPDNYPGENQKPSPYSDRSVSHSTVYGADGRVVESQAQRKVGSIADYDPTNYSSTLPHSSLRQTQEWEETVVFSPQNFPSQPCNNQTSSAGELRYSSLERPVPVGTDGKSSSSLAGNRDVKPYGGAAVTGGQPAASSDLAEDQQYLAQQQQLLQQQQDLQQQQQQVKWQQQQQQQQQQQHVQQQQMREQQQQQQQLREQQQFKEQQIREQQLREQQQFKEQQIREQQLREQQLLQQQRQQQKDELSMPCEQTAQNVQHSRKLAGTIFQAMYDYDAQDDDEVSFVENDLVINCDPIDEGWMYGTIQRTGQRGMLPANYVERVQ